VNQESPWYPGSQEQSSFQESVENSIKYHPFISIGLGSEVFIGDSAIGGFDGLNGGIGGNYILLI
jgi:hypothetical protein